MTTNDFPSLAEALLPSVLAAGAVEMRHHAAGVTVETKNDSSPVTVADREAEAILLEGLRTAAPGVPVVAEECVAAGDVPVKGSAYFLVDPLDGTREFIKGSSEFTVNIGLVVDGVPVFGMIYAPVIGALFVTLGRGRAVETAIRVDELAPSLTNRPLKDLATRTPDLDALIVVTSRSHRAESVEAFLAGYAVAEVRRGGSSLKFCQIARGDADFYVRLGPTNEWDTAAGQAILIAAGGCVTTLDGTPLPYGTTPDMINPPFVAWSRAPIAPSKR
ncbi:3'(2'),5'-bisphosphate nucleotidase CysQ [Hyphomicrobium sp.]|uniref:3'(2'),5'-bisphosphate nucleotidase CysQ n=1 Tax=Hyphomicrobium sp. TaxID=82 RepID=UPI002C96AE80|nr:3'(2'),5'-bisphosphate nucleotidase CysQ [Hyphomicrobium sp.]HRN88099.1 3'(2'),5'-bisphosphate nucleotidase CysQ [Hyphomicrobium sp.]HRQ25903.1 3'(2'),5'-bisphosphate nucleotidase CysQ [Hyphomicrobium sp.]